MRAIDSDIPCLEAPRNTFKDYVNESWPAEILGENFPFGTQPLNLKILAGDRGRYFKDGKWIDFVGPCWIDFVGPCEVELEVTP